jgi:transposase
MRLNIMTKTGRKTKLTPKLQEEIIKYVEAGNYAKDACQAVGIGRSTFYDWLKWCKEGREPFSEFLDTIKKAKTKAVIRNVLIIQTEAKKRW